MSTGDLYIGMLIWFLMAEISRSANPEDNNFFPYMVAGIITCIAAIISI